MPRLDAAMSLARKFKSLSKWATANAKHFMARHWFIYACGLYYKQVMIVNDNSSIISKWCSKLSDDPRVVIYDRHRFIIQATGVIENIVLTILEWKFLMEMLI
jgi:hypothetical protein